MKYPKEVNNRRYSREESEKLAMDLFAPCEPFSEDEYCNEYTAEEEGEAKRALTAFLQQFRNVTPTTCICYPDENYYDFMRYILLIRSDIQNGRFHYACCTLRELIHYFVVFEIRIYTALTALYQWYLSPKEN